MVDVCVQCKAWRKQQYWNASSGNKHHFFKIMLGEFRSFLIIPRKFIAESRVKLSEKVTLRGPSGSIWTTDLARRGEDYVLENGWQDFVKDHSLNTGDFLVFRHVEDSMFNVLIFDTTGCEREGSYFIEGSGQLCADNCCSMRNNTNPQTNTTFKSADEGKKQLDEEGLMEEEEEEEEEEESGGEQSEPDNQGTRYLKYYESSRRAITEKDMERAFHLASKHLTKQPSCKIRMKTSHVHHLFILTIPREFADNCLPRQSQVIRLRVGSKTWRVRLNRRNAQCTLTGGWAQFVFENNLETEDMCVLELVDAGTSQKPTILDVHIFRAVEEIVPLKVVKPFKPR